jgi:NADPH2:quinone reductase
LAHRYLKTRISLFINLPLKSLDQLTLGARLMLRRLTLTGSTLRARSVQQKAEVAAALREKIWPLLDNGLVKPLIHATFPLEQARQAHEMMESSSHLGKILLVTGK